MARYPVTIASGQSLSPAVNLGGPEARKTVVAVLIPSTWDAASLTFQAAENETDTYLNIYRADGVEVAIDGSGASRWVPIPPTDLPSIRWIKVRSGTSGAPVVQTSDTTVVFITREAA